MIKDYVKTCGDVYIFPVGFIETHDVLSDLLEEFPLWCESVVMWNKTEPVGILWEGGVGFQLWRERAFKTKPCNKIWVNDGPCVLGGL